MLDYKKRLTLEKKKDLSWEDAIEAIRKNWYDLRYVNKQTEEICLEAVKQNWDALRYVNEIIFANQIEEMTLEQICKKLWKNIKIIK